MKRSPALKIAVLLLAVVPSGCGLLSEDDVNRPKVDVTGVWSGTENVVVSSNSAFPVDRIISNVTLDLVQTDTYVTGTYDDNNLLAGTDNTFDIFGSVSENRFAIFRSLDGTLGYITTVDTTVDGLGTHMNMTFSPNGRYSDFETRIKASKEQVSIVATTGTANEETLLPGVFTVTRSIGSASSPLTVNYSVGGTATSGVDYVPIGTSVTIPADNTIRSTTIRVVPINDTIPDNGETVTVTLAPGKGYTVGAPSSATVTILDTD